MKQLFAAVFATFLGLTFMMSDAEAASKRLGGGKNTGTQRESIKSQPQATPQQAAPAPGAAAAPRAGAPAPAASGASRWLGPLAGLAAGGLLAAMFMGGGFDGIKFMDVIMLALLIGAAFFVIRMLMRKSASQTGAARPEPMQYAGTGPQPAVPATAPVASGGSVAGSVAMPVAARRFPDGFNAEEFAGHAKLNFVRLQDANDRKDISTLRDFLSPELFSEIDSQMRARGDEPQKTEVVTIAAQVLDVVTEGDVYIASVQFDGTIKDAPSAAPEAFTEIWHLQKSVNGRSGWMLSGIQQG